MSALHAVPRTRPLSVNIPSVFLQTPSHALSQPSTIYASSRNTTAARMAQRNMPWDRRRKSLAPSPTSTQNGPDAAYPPLQRSLSELSPISPLSSNAGLDQRRPLTARFGSLGRRRKSEQPTRTVQYSERSLDAHAENTHESRRGIASSQRAPAWSSAPERYPQQQQPYTGFSPVSSNPYDDWNQHSSSIPSEQTYMTSPTSYASSGYFRREANAPHRPIAAHTYPPVTISRPGHDTEVPVDLDDEFTSPTDFALFAQATSSLSFSPAPSPSWDPLSIPPQIPPSSSSTFPYLRPPIRPTPPLLRHQSSQLLAEAMSGLEMDEEREEMEDELPNYEQSQAEVTARRRDEAARRARELDEAWMRAKRRGRGVPLG